jgi:hypothetical protein
VGANVGATRANDLPARRTSADKRLAIMPGREPIRTTLNAIQVTTSEGWGFGFLRAGQINGLPHQVLLAAIHHHSPGVVSAGERSERVRA